MIKSAVILAAAALGVAALAQDNPDEQFLAVEGDGPWYLQRTTCTLAHNDDATGVTLWFRLSMGLDVEFADRRLRGVRDGSDAELVVAIDSRQEQTFAQGTSWEDGRSGYRMLTISDPVDLEGGRRLEIRRGNQVLVQIPLAGVAPALAALRDCQQAAADMIVDENAAMPDGNYINAL